MSVTDRTSAAPGESAEVLTIVPEYNDPLRFGRLAADLASRGWPAGRIDKLLGANFARLFAEVWDAGAAAPSAAAPGGAAPRAIDPHSLA